MSLRDNLSNMPLQPMLAPSILAADFSRLGQQVLEAEQAGIQILHIDVMDGHFVPNISLGPCVVSSLRPNSSLLFDVHLMLSNPEKYIDAFRKAGANHITVHVESCGNLADTIRHIHELGCTAGISLRPGTSAAGILPYLPMVEMALVMLVEPGFGGQSFMESQLEKVAALRSWAKKNKPNLHIEVDGGIQTGNIRKAWQAGADVFVAGSSIFHPGKTIGDCIEKLTSALH